MVFVSKSDKTEACERTGFEVEGLLCLVVRISAKASSCFGAAIEERSKR